MPLATPAGQEGEQRPRRPLSKTSQDDCPAGPSFDRLPRIALSAAARNAGKPAIEGNNLSWRFGGTAQPLPAFDQAADLVDGAGGVLVAAQIEELQIGREAKRGIAIAHPVAKRRRRDDAPLRVGNLEGDIAAWPIASSLQFSL